MPVWNVLHAARWKYRMQKWRKKSPSGHHRTNLPGWIFATKACIDNRKKNLLNSNTSSTCPHNIATFGPLAAEICWRICGTHHISTGIASWYSLTARHSSNGRQWNFAALNRGRLLYSAGRQSHWALAHILVLSANVSVYYIVGTANIAL